MQSATGMGSMASQEYTNNLRLWQTDQFLVYQQQSVGTQS